MEICLLTGCNREATIRDLCRGHYNQLVKNSLITHGVKGGFLTDSPTWKSWDNVKTRCRKVNSKHYIGYGSKGIQMCDRWYGSVKDFYHDLGPRPKGKSIDRIDNNGHYSCGKCQQCIENDWPMNCRWATAREQNANRADKNKHGYTGVKFKRGRYEAYIGISGTKKGKYLGSFPTPEEAGAAYQKAKNELKE